MNSVNKQILPVFRARGGLAHRVAQGGHLARKVRRSRMERSRAARPRAGGARLGRGAPSKRSTATRTRAAGRPRGGGGGRGAPAPPTRRAVIRGIEWRVAPLPRRRRQPAARQKSGGTKTRAKEPKVPKVPEHQLTLLSHKAFAAPLALVRAPGRRSCHAPKGWVGRGQSARHSRPTPQGGPRLTWRSFCFSFAPAH